MTIGTDSERAPLLGHGDANHRTDSDTDASESETASTVLPPATRLISPAKRILVLALSFTLLITLAIGSSLLNVPIAEIQEENICRHIHGPEFDPAKCKDKNVQSELSLIRGWDTTYTLIPSFLTSVPYGAVADRYGRTLVLGLSLLGVTLKATSDTTVCAMPHVFHPRTIWLGSLFQFLGGGETVSSAMIYTIVADISTEEQRVSAFFYIGASLMGGSLIANPIVYVAMKRGAWFAVFTGLICLFVSTAIGFLTPETLDKAAAVETSPVDPPADGPSQLDDTTSLRTGDTTPSSSANCPSSAQQDSMSNPPRQVNTLLSRAVAALIHTVHSARFLFWDHKLVGFLLISLTLEIFGRSSFLQLIQYATKRYGMSYSEAGLLQSVTAFTALILLLVVLPGTSRILHMLRVSDREKELRLAQASAVLSAAGTMLQGLAETKTVLVAGIVVAGMGGGYTFMIRSLMTSLVGGHEIGVMYTSIAFVGTFAVLAAGPMFAGLFNVGLGWGDAWVGLPFTVAGWVLVAAAVLVGVIRSSMVVGVGKADDGESDEGHG